MFIAPTSFALVVDGCRKNLPLGDTGKSMASFSESEADQHDCALFQDGSVKLFWTESSLIVLFLGFSRATTQFMQSTVLGLTHFALQ